MLTGIIGLIGTALGFLPAILQYMTVRANNAQSLALKQLELDAATKGYAFQIDLENAKADTAQQEHVYSFAAAPSGVKWIDGLAVLVRPYITMWLFHIYLGGLAFLTLYAIANGVPFKDIIQNVFDDSFKGLVAAIVGFWFGDRGGKRMMSVALASSAPPRIGTPRRQDDADVPETPAPSPAPSLRPTTIPAPPGSRPDVSGL